jgi:hypothetical protein
MRFAQDTIISPERSRVEIETLLKKYQATTFGYATDAGQAMVQFRLHDRIVRFLIPMPKIEDARKTPAGRQRRRDKVPVALAQEERRRWRALLLVIKAKLEAVDSNITNFETEFLAHIVMPDGKTVGAHILPAVAAAYASGKMPKGLLPAWGGE